MKSRIVPASEIAAHPNLSLSAKDYIDETPKVEKQAMCLDRIAVLRVVDALRLYRQAAERVMNQTGVWAMLSPTSSKRSRRSRRSYEVTHERMA